MSAFQDQNYSYKEVYEALNPISRPHIDFYVLMFLATVISTFGLLLDNPAVIIGAMLIAPLMDPILGISFSSLTRNGRFLFRSVLTLVSGIFLAVLVSYLLSITEEVWARTRPSLLDLFVALATGFIAGYARVRKHIGGTIYGVAVSISLIPPLCVVGIGLANLRQEIYSGASLLFLTNLVSILFSGVLAFLLIRLGSYRKSLKSLLLPGVSLLLLAIPLSFSLFTIQQKRTLETELRHILQLETYTFRNVEIVNINTDVYRKPVTMEVTVRGTESDITANQVTLVEELLEHKVGIPVSLIVNLSPIVQIKGVNPKAADNKATGSSGQ